MCEKIAEMMVSVENEVVEFKEAKLFAKLAHCSLASSAKDRKHRKSLKERNVIPPPMTPPITGMLSRSAHMPRPYTRKTKNAASLKITDMYSVKKAITTA